MLATLAVWFGCSDPPSPPNLPNSTGSTARFVEWADPIQPTSRPVVVIVDLPGGALDQLVADNDVTTFLNDRFHPLFFPAFADQPAGSVSFYSADGCLLAGPQTPQTPAAFIAVANTVIVRPEANGRSAAHFPGPCTLPTHP